MLTPHSFFDLSDYRHPTLFNESEPVWSALVRLKTYMDSFSYPAALPAEMTSGTPLRETVILHNNKIYPGNDCQISYGDTCKGALGVIKDGATLNGASILMAGAILVGSKIAIGQGTLIEGGATIKEPVIIGNNTEIRQGAYMRGYCLIGDRCVVGHTTEVKHSIFLDDAKAGHFAYLGDSILGNDANLGAGTKFANLKFIPGNVQIFVNSKLIDTGMRKFGAILGDKAQTGCNSVTNPGTLLGRRGVIMPNTTAPSGYHKDRHRIR